MNKNELTAKVTEIMGVRPYLDMRVEISENNSLASRIDCLPPKEGTKDYAITITQMYEYVEFGFDELAKLSELFQTRNINIGNRYSSPGCETCDYGSRYVITVWVKDSPISMG